MKTKILIALVIMAAALYFNNDFIQPQPEGYDWAYQEDHRNVLAGYNKVHSFADTLPWLTGFIDEAHPSFRPISSYMFYGMTWLGEHHGYEWNAWITYLLFVLCCLLMAVVAYRLTRSHVAALVAGVLCSNAAAWLPTMQTKAGGIPFDWHYLSDNTAMIAPLLGSLIAFLLWREYGQRKYLAFMWACAVAAYLTKEQAYCLPFLLAALCFASLPEYSVSRRRALLQCGYMACLSVAFFAFRSIVVQGAHNPPNRDKALVEAAQGWIQAHTPPSPYEIVLLMNAADAIQAVAGYALVFGALYYGWKHRVEVRAAIAPVVPLMVTAGLLWISAMIAYAPALGFDVAGHRGLLSVFLKCASFTVAGYAVLQPILSHQRSGYGAMLRRRQGSTVDNNLGNVADDVRSTGTTAVVGVAADA